MTGHEKIAARNIKGAFNWIIGENYNSYQDGNESDISDMTAEEWKAYIYDLAMNDLYEPGMTAYGRAPKEMRFAGETFCREYINKLWDKDEDIKELQSVGKMLPAPQKQPKTVEKASGDKSINFKEKTTSELEKIAKKMRIEITSYKDERIYRMHLVMDIKAAMKGDK